MRRITVRIVKDMAFSAVFVGVAAVTTAGFVELLKLIYE